MKNTILLFFLFPGTPINVLLARSSLGLTRSISTQDLVDGILCI